MNARTRRYGGTIVLVAACAASLSCRSVGITPRTFDPNLPKSIDAMTAGELWDAADPVGFTLGPYQERDCAQGTCEGRFDAVAGQVPGPGTVTANGTIVARIVNAGGGLFSGNRGEEQRYKATLRGGNRRYYVIARSDGSGGWSWSVREAIRNGTSLARETARGTWTTCALDSSNPDHPRSKSQFAKCPHGADNDDANGSGEALRMIYSRVDPGWLTCTEGCCTAGAQ